MVTQEAWKAGAGIFKADAAVGGCDFQIAEACSVPLVGGRRWLGERNYRICAACAQTAVDWLRASANTVEES